MDGFGRRSPSYEKPGTNGENLKRENQNASGPLPKGAAILPPGGFIGSEKRNEKRAQKSPILSRIGSGGVSFTIRRIPSLKGLDADDSVTGPLTNGYGELLVDQMME